MSKRNRKVGWLGAALAVFGSIVSAAERPAASIPKSWSATVQEQIADSEYHVSWQGGSGWQAPNRANNLRTTFTNDGIRVTPRTAERPAWEWALTFVGAGRPGAVTPIEPAKLRVDGNRIAYDREGIVEWYVNDRKGLEQGFTLNAPPSLDRGATFIDLSLAGTLDPSFSSDGQAIDFKAPGGAIVLHYAQLAVADARGQMLPAHMEGFVAPGMRGIRLAFDDTDAVYPVTVDPLATSAAWSASGHQDSAWFGRTLATAGDVNGDGYSDVIVGAPSYDNGQSDEGRAFVFLGTASGLAAAPVWTAESDQASSYFGWSVATAGDVNGDGYTDVIVGADQYGNGQFQEGRAFVYMGSASGLGLTAAWTAESNQAGAYFGTSVATAGDVNGDGYADVIVSAPEYAFSVGRAFVYLGSASGLATTAAWTKDGAQDVEFGNAVASAGDVNGDGYADVVIGAENHDTDQINEGRAYLYLGGSSGLAAIAAWTAEGDSNGAHLGRAVATAGDVNGDGYADVIVGADAFTNGQSAEGRALIYLGTATGLTATAAWSVESNVANARLGSSVATAGDINGDGYADVVVGAPQNGAGIGRAELYLGSASGPSTTSIWLSETPNQAADKFGWSVATAGDVNGDGYSDVIAGAYQYNDGQSGSGGAFVYLGSAAALALAPAWTVESDQSDTQLGESVATAGDVNGDGYSDVVVGASLFDNGNTDEGRAFVYLGSAAGLATSAAWTAEADQFAARFGSSVAAAGDVNGDGYSDVIVGAFNYDNGQSDEGRAYVYLGSAAGLGGSATWIAEGDQVNAYFGWSVATAGDVNGDGYGDVIIGAFAYDDGEVDEGRASVYLGSAAGLSPAPAWTARGNHAYAGFATSVASAGDVNGDGYGDVIIGANRFDDPQTDEGRVFVYLGSGTGLSASVDWAAESGQASSLFGSSVAAAGDVNGDGFSDVIVGAPYHDNGQTDEGRAYIYLGSASGLASSAAWTAESDQASASYGESVATAGDVNGDGYSDVIVGAPYYGNGQPLEGRAYLYLGSASGLATSFGWIAESDQSAGSYGCSVATAGDVNGDGYSDVIVGAERYSNGQSLEGKAYVYYGGGGDGLDRIPRQTRTDGVTPVALSGKSDSETEFRARVRGRTPAGRGNIRLQWEAKPLGTPFSGTGLGASPAVLTGSPGAAGSAVNFNQSVASLSEGTFYHWRARTVSVDPFFPRSPWLSLAGNNVTETKLHTAGCVDRDGDGYGDRGDPSCLSLVPDCNPTNPAIWGTPGEIANLRFTSKTALSWDVPVSPGALASALVYDTLRSGLASNFAAADCLESDDGPNTTAIDPELPSAGHAFFYLNRAQDSCPAGVGSLGTNHAGAERTGVACP